MLYVFPFCLQKEKVKLKKEQLAEKVRRSPNDCSSLEVQSKQKHLCGNYHLYFNVSVD